jgi:hypothetical protein
MQNNWGRRASDNGKESPETVLARIDERVKNIILDNGAVKLDLIQHKEDDKRQFDEIKKNIYYAGGGVCVIVFFLNWFHK